jgi:hypothetical protein
LASPGAADFPPVRLSAMLRKPCVYAGQTDPPPFTMRLSNSFVNG